MVQGKHDYDKVREKLNEVIEMGLSQKSIAKNTGIGENELSRFRRSKFCLKWSDAEILYNYLNKVVIPQHF